jgi:hypothetical protein
MTIAKNVRFIFSSYEKLRTKIIRFGQPRRADIIEIEFNKYEGSLTFVDRGGIQSRNAGTIHMFVEALKTIRPELKSFYVQVLTGDFPSDVSNRLTLAYSRRRTQSNVIAIPDFIFWSWPEVGVSDYKDIVSQMLEASKVPPPIDKLFWVGNTRMHPTRKQLLDMAAGRTDMLIEDTVWVPKQRVEEFASDSVMSTKNQNYYSLPEHCRFKYLIDMQGAGYSARLKILLFSGRPLFIQSRPWEEYFFDRLVPFEHYVPVAENLEDLDEKLEWARGHPVEASRIASAAQEFAKNNLTREAAIAYLRNILLREFGSH